MRADRIDYYLMPPIIDDEDDEARRGSIALCKATPAEEPGRPFCIRIGAELLSCRTQAEQNRWIDAVNQAAEALSLSMPRSPDRIDIFAAEFLPGMQLVMLRPDGLVEMVKQREPSTVLLSGADSIVSILHFDEPHHATSGSFTRTKSSEAFVGTRGAHALSTLSLVGCTSGDEIVFPVQPLASLQCLTGRHCESQWRLHVRVLSDELVLSLAMIVLVGGMLVMETQRPHVGKTQRRVTFIVDRVSKNDAVPGALFTSTPKWVGQWMLDKACSESYDPILADLGVMYIVRKAADAANSVLTISLSPTDVTIHVKIWVSVEDCIPLDGSPAVKPVPPGSKMKGRCTVRLTKCTDTEFEMLTTFPAGNGELRDTLVVHEDGESFTRVVVRGDLSVTRVFRRKHRT